MKATGHNRQFVGIGGTIPTFVPSNCDAALRAYRQCPACWESKHGDQFDDDSGLCRACRDAMDAPTPRPAGKLRAFINNLFGRK